MSTNSHSIYKELIVYAVRMALPAAHVAMRGSTIIIIRSSMLSIVQMEVVVIIINHHEHHHHLIIIMTQQKKIYCSLHVHYVLLLTYIYI